MNDLNVGGAHVSHGDVDAGDECGREDEDHGRDPDDEIAAPVAGGGACGCADEAEKGDAEEERAVVVGARDECEGRPEVGHLCSVPVCVEVKCFGCHEDSLLGDAAARHRGKRLDGGVTVDGALKVRDVGKETRDLGDPA